jgi:hypothetical protein
MVIDVGRFFDALAMAALLIRVQVIYNLATDEMFSARSFRAHSASARLRAVAMVATAESMEVW